MDGINVLSLFDGMGCATISLIENGIKTNKIFVSEIDKFAIKQTKLNFPNNIHLGDVTKIDVSQLPKIDLLLGGSPCQSFSFSGKRNGMSTKCDIEILTLYQYLELKNNGFEFEGQSYLFWEYMRILKQIKTINPNIKFMLENVEMGIKWENVLTKAIGVKGIHINSALVSAQNRKRIYWTNIGLKPIGLFNDLKSTIKQPNDRGILLKDILQPESEIDKKYYLSKKMTEYVTNPNNKSQSANRLMAMNNKTQSLMACDKSPLCVAMRGRNSDNPNSREIGIETMQMLEFRDDNKTNCLTTVQKDNLICGCDYRSDEGFRIRKDNKSNTLLARAREDKWCSGLVKYPSYIRRLTPTECARLQTIPSWYKWDVSDSQQYKMLGNGWTIEVIKHILNYL